MEICFFIFLIGVLILENWYSFCAFVYLYQWSDILYLRNKAFKSRWSCIYYLWCLGSVCRECVDGKHTHYNCGGRGRGAGSGMGHGTTRMDSWHRKYRDLFSYLYFHLQSCCRLLQISRPCHWPEKLYLYAGCQGLLRYSKFP